MSEFGAYIAALFIHLVPVLGAGPFLIDRLITWFWQRGRSWLDQHPQRRRIYLGCFLFSLVIAGFTAWKAEHDRFMSSVFRLDVPIVTIEGGKTYKVLPEDYLIAVASVTNTTTTLLLPPNPHRGQRFEIKDANGAISPSFPIVVNGNGNNVDQKTTFEMNQPAQSIVVTYNGIKWLVT
jgi:hypothetical protein